MSFKILKKDVSSNARTGVLTTSHGEVHTPVFLPIATKGSVKGVNNDELKSAIGAEMILVNTYHLWGVKDLHGLMNWDSAIFTDSGGYQLFSLGEKREKTEARMKNDDPFNVEVSEDGVSFQRGDNGNAMLLTPEKSIEIQTMLGSDVMVCLDEFTGEIDNYEKVKATVERTSCWADRSKNEFEKWKSDGDLLLGIVQGALFRDLRKKSAQEIRDIGFDGYAIGGVAVSGESSDQQYKAVDMSLPYFEEEKFKHLLGVGTPDQIIENVARGIDSFDCVIPTREARHGRLYVRDYAPQITATKQMTNFKYQTIDITKSLYQDDFLPIDPHCPCYGCRNHSKAYVHHLFRNKELLGLRLSTLHNLQFYADLMSMIRGSINEGFFSRVHNNL